MARHGQRELGDKIGPKLVHLVTEATVAARARIAPHEARIHQAASQALIDRAGHEIADLYRPLVEHALTLSKHDPHPHVAEYLKSISSGTHQWQAIAGFAGGAATSAFTSVLSNALAPLVYKLNSESPNLAIDQNTTAQAVAAGIISYAQGEHTASEWGYDSGEFETLYRLAQTPPPVSTLQQLVNWGFMSENDALGWMRRQGIDESVRQKILDLRQTPLSPADLADMVVRGIIEQKYAAGEAYKSGVGADQFNQLVLDTGEPPSLTDLAMAHRRGYIDTARFIHGIRQSRVRDEWVDVLTKLNYVPMSVADAVTAFVQGHADLNTVKEVANANGLEEKYINTLIETAGTPISITESIELLRRGQIDEKTVIEAIREGRLKDKYIPYVLKLRTHIPPAREVATLYSHAALSEAKAKEVLAQSGYDQEMQQAFITEATHGKVAAVKEITLRQASQLYLDQIISWQEADKLLRKIGYSDLELSYVKELLNDQILYKNRESSISKLRTLFIAYHITGQEVSSQLDALHVMSGQRDKLIELWTIERESNYRHLTEAQIVDAWEYNLIDAPTAASMLEEIGYPPPYAKLLIEIKAKGPVKGL